MLAAISIIFISIPLYRIILRMYKTEDENTHTAQIKSEDKGQPKVAVYCLPALGRQVSLCSLVPRGL